MTKILVNPWGSLGDLHPFLAVAMALRELGAEVTIATMRDYETTVTGLGFPFLPAGPHFQPNDRIITDALADAKRGTHRLLTELLLPAVPATFAELDAAVASHDVTVTHPAGLAAMTSVERHGKAWVSTALMPSAMFSRYDPPFIPLIPRLSHLARMAPPFGAALRTAVKVLAQRQLTEVIRLRQSLGLGRRPPPFLIDAQSPDLHLALFDAALGRPQPDWPRSSQQPGACLFSSEPELPEAAEAALAAFLAHGEAPVVVTLGSAAVHAARRFFVDSHAALAALGLRGLLLMGDNRLPATTAVAADRFLCLRYVPFHRVFGAARAIVCQGGVGTLAWAMRAGKPILVVPFSHDQPDNATRVQRLGIGLALPADRFDTKSATAALSRLLTTPAIATRAAALPAALTSNGAIQAARAILNLTVSNRSAGRSSDRTHSRG